MSNGGDSHTDSLHHMCSMINDLATDALIYWATDGASFFSKAGRSELRLLQMN